MNDTDAEAPRQYRVWYAKNAHPEGNRAKRRVEVAKRRGQDTTTNLSSTRLLSRDVKKEIDKRREPVPEEEEE